MRNKPSQQFTFETDCSKIDRADWTSFVHMHPSGSVFQSPQMVELLKSADGMDAITLFCLDESGRILGLCIASLLWSEGFLLKKFSLRSVVYGNPLIREGSEEITAAFLDKLISVHPRGVIYIQLRNNGPDESLSAYLRESGFVFEDHLNYIFDLTIGKDKLWAGLHPTRRKQIRRSVRREVTTEIHDSVTGGLLEECYSLLKDVYKRINLPLPGLSYFRIAEKVLSGEGIFKCITASYKGTIIGFRFFLSYDGVLYDWYAASKPEHSDRYPNDILPWAIIEWGSMSGMSKFDFGGAGNPREKYGVRDFKEKFGGEMVNFGRETKVLKPLRYRLGELAIKLLKLTGRK